MKVLQPKLVLGTEGRVLIDATNLKSKSNSTGKKRKRENVENVQPQKVTRKDGIYCDPPVPSHKANLVDSSTQTDSSLITNELKEKILKVKDMLTSEDPPPEYWKSIAEKRRQNLEATLEENQFLKEENDFLRGENKILEEILVEAKQLATIVQEVAKDEDKCDRESSKRQGNELDSLPTHSDARLEEEEEDL